MKEPKFPKLEDIPRDHKYDFFAEGVFPDTEDQKLDTQKKSRLPFSLPVNVGKKISNTQKDDDLVPFFAKNYPSSSESKEEVCFINSPPPSDTPDNTGEAEEVEGEESESDEDGNKKDKKNEKNNNKKNNNLNNDEIGVSVDFNSEMEYEYDNPSKMMSREEVQELMRKRKIQKEKEEQERKKKEEEEKRKEDEERKRKEEEEKKKRKEEEKKKKDEESKRRKDEESKKRKDEEKKKKEKEKEEKEKLKKIEEEKKKKIKSNKKDPLNLLSSIKKNYDDNSNMASNSMINDVQNFFAIPEEKGENEDEDEDTSKKNFKKNSIASEKKSKSKKNPKPITNEENKDKKEENANKSKNNKLSRKSNGLKANNEEEKKEKKPVKKEEEKSDSEKEEEYSNYGDQLADTQTQEKDNEDSDSPPKKEKVKEKKKPKKGNKAKKMTKNNEISVVQMYNVTMGAEGVKKIPYEIIQNEEEQTFGNGRYSRRNRIHTLNHELGERPKYVYDELGLPNLKYVIKANKNILYNSIMAKAEEIHNKKMKRLVKGLSHKNNETIPEESNEYNSDNLDSENISEYGEDDARILKIPKGGKKSLAKNYDTVLMIKIIEANGKNIIRVDKKEYKNLKNNNQVKVDKNQEFEILNFSDNFLVVQLVFDEDN